MLSLGIHVKCSNDVLMIGWLLKRSVLNTNVKSFGSWLLLCYMLYMAPSK